MDNLAITATPQPARALHHARRRSLLWRIHAWAALIASPFALAAALSGMLYVFTPQLEAMLHGHLDKVVPMGAARPLDASVQLARHAAPEGWALHSVLPPLRAEDSVKVAFMPAARNMRNEHAGHGATPASPAFLRPSFGVPVSALVVYVNPYSESPEAAGTLHHSAVLGSLMQSKRFSNWARKLHSTYLVDGWRWVIELAASWLLVMLISGVFLWWPQRQELSQDNAPAAGRARWQRWHAWTGVTLSLMSAVILVTGLTWSKHAGEQIRWARDALGQQSPRIPGQLRSSPALDAKPMLGWQAAWDAARAIQPQSTTQVAMQLMPPRAEDGPGGFWRANHLERSPGETGAPTRRFALLLDAYSGQALYFSGWEAQTAFGKATAIGIPFHRGEFGLWNQALLLLFGLGVVFSILSGWVMYFKRRQRGMAGLPGLLPQAWRSVSPWAWGGTALLLLALPLLALSSLVVLAIEALLWQRRRQVATTGAGQ